MLEPKESEVELNTFPTDEGSPADAEACNDKAPCVMQPTTDRPPSRWTQLCLSSIAQHFLTLKVAPVELWLVYLLKFLESYAYFSFSIIFPIYLTQVLVFGVFMPLCVWLRLSSLGSQPAFPICSGRTAVKNTSRTA